MAELSVSHLLYPQVLTYDEFAERKRAGAILPGPFGGWMDTAPPPDPTLVPSAHAHPARAYGEGVPDGEGEGLLARVAKRMKRRRDGEVPGDPGASRPWRPCSIM